MEALKALRLLVAGHYIDLAAGSLAVFDFLLTFDLEVEFIWKSEWSIIKGMYFFNRYSALLEYVSLFIRSNTTDPTHCPGLIKAEGVIYILGLYSAEYIFAIRTYIVWDKSKIIAIPLGLFYVGTLIYNFVSYYWALNVAHYSLLPVIGGCLAELPPSGLFVSMVILVGYDATMIIMIGLAAINVWRRSSGVGVKPDLFRVLYGEGVLFYVYLLGFSIVSLIGVKVSSPFLFIFMGRCVRSILASRVILHLRHTAHSRRQAEFSDSSNWRHTIQLP